MSSVDKSLFEAACLSRDAAYAPYSKFKVGAALRSASGKIFTGANVENISFGPTICAERVCIGSAVAAGERQFHDLVIVTDALEPAVPCGACRQVIAEFSSELRVTCVTIDGTQQHFTISELLPRASQGIDVHVEHE